MGHCARKRSSSTRSAAELKLAKAARGIGIDMRSSGIGDHKQASEGCLKCESKSIAKTKEQKGQGQIGRRTPMRPPQKECEGKCKLLQGRASARGKAA